MAESVTPDRAGGPVHFERPERMRALRATGYGAIDERLEEASVPVPEVGPTEVLIACVAASINPHDVKSIRGDFARMENATFPYTVGGDLSGVVVAKGADVTSLEVGDEVFGVARGAIAEFTSAEADTVARKPANVSHELAASLPVAGLTAVQGLRHARIRAGDRVLVHAGSGGVGSLAIQCAKARGAFVITTARAENGGWLTALGADLVIDYEREDYRELVSDVDIVFDTLGGEHTFDAFTVLGPGGRVVSLLPAEITREVARELGLPPLARFVFSLKRSRIARLAKEKGASYRYFFVDVANRHDLRELAGLVETGAIVPVVERVYDFADAPTAFVDLAAGHAKGKLVIGIR